MSVHSKHNDVSYLLIDNGDGPGVPDEIMVGLGFKPGSGKGKKEFDTFTCNHCEKVFLKNPLRVRERGWCKQCDKYICDECAARLVAIGVCKPFKLFLNDVAEAVDKGRTADSVSQHSVKESVTVPLIIIP